MEDEVDEDEDQAIRFCFEKFKNFSERGKNSFIKQCVAICKHSQLQLLHEDIERILARDFVALMPTELSEKIFFYLDVTSLCKSACVNRKWRKVSESNKVWYLQCFYRSWTSLSNDESIFDEPEFIRSRPSSASRKLRNSSNSPLFFDFNEANAFKNSTDCRKWKKFFIRIYHLERNWAEGYYVVKPVLRGHQQPVSCMDCNGRVIASGSLDKTARIWNLLNCQCIAILTDFQDSVKCMKLLEHNLVSGCSDGIIYLHELTNFTLIRTLAGHFGSVDHICCGDGLIFSASSIERTIRVWSAESGVCLKCFTGHTDDIELIKWGGNLLLSASWDESVKIWNVEEGICIHTLRGHTEVILCLQFDEQKVITGSADGLIIIWDMITGHLKQTLHGHSAEVYCLECNDEIIASGSADSTIRIWSIQGAHLFTLDGHIGIVRCLNLWRTRLISGGDCKKLIIWDTLTGKLLNAVHRNPTSLHLMWTDRTKIVTASPETPGTITVLSYLVFYLNT